ncbi:MAG: hypothetical protein OXE97_07910 [Gammaproteobacteria bacterium]|nr:hypothetical protein [Gammaproteobacteria bacterium]MCY4312907.1 hypothetical protein [Gammaproteobacteria bacterium]
MPQLPDWLEQLRNIEIIQRVKDDPRSASGQYLGVSRSVATREAAGWGQADFDKPWNHLSPDDRVLLYAYFLQLGHLEELIRAFGMLFARGLPSEQPIVIDLGCGPFTGGLAFTNALGSERQFDYIGVDRSVAMRRLGERLAAAAEQFKTGIQISRHWSSGISSISWNQPPSWRPVFVIVSYLLASPTVNVNELLNDLMQLLTKLGQGPVTILYTNSQQPEANKQFPDFARILSNAGFSEIEDDIGGIRVERMSGPRGRKFRYALFHRSAQNTLTLGDG